jgi:hypothetical protein
VNRVMLRARVELVAVVLSFQALGAGPAQRGSPQMVDAGGYMVRAQIEGQGSPAVVFVAGGFGAPLESWGEVTIKTSRFTQTVAYDRGGTGMSEAAPPPRDSKHITHPGLPFSFHGGDYQVPAEVLSKPLQQSLRQHPAWWAELLAC